MTLKPRIPLWVTLVPLVVGLSVYWCFWRDNLNAFRTEVVAIFGPDADLSMGGFPYRLEATLNGVRLERRTAREAIGLSAQRLVMNRQPWGGALTVAHAIEPSVWLMLPDLDGAKALITAAVAQSSLRGDATRIDRLSTVFDNARIALGLLPFPARADRFELHLRETPSTPDLDDRAATPPAQVMLVLRGTALRLQNSDPLMLEAEVALTGRTPLRSIAAWRDGGTVEVKRLTLADATGGILDMTATAAPGPQGKLMLAGTIATVCPRTLAAAFAGQRTAPEQRARRPLRLPFSGEAGGVRLTLPDSSLPHLATRAQLPPCPALR